MNKLQTVYIPTKDLTEFEQPLIDSLGDFIFKTEAFVFTPEEFKQVLSDAFQSAREFNSLDGVVDVDVVLPMGGDTSDLQAIWINADDYIKNFLNK